MGDYGIVVDHLDRSEYQDCEFSVVNLSVSIFSAAAVSDLMTGELSVAVMIGKWSENVVEIFRIIVSCPNLPTHVKRGSGVLSDTSCHKVDVVLRTVMRVIA